jgi:hypothetical protein
LFKSPREINRRLKNNTLSRDGKGCENTENALIFNPLLGRRAKKALTHNVHLLSLAGQLMYIIIQRFVCQAFFPNFADFAEIQSVMISP